MDEKENLERIKIEASITLATPPAGLFDSVLTSLTRSNESHERHVGRVWSSAVPLSVAELVPGPPVSYRSNDDVLPPPRKEATSSVLFCL